MPKYLIEFRHSTEHEGCVRSLNAILEYGSHIITNAEWGFFAKPFTIDDVWIGWPKVLVEAIQAAPVLEADALRSLAR